MEINIVIREGHDKHGTGKTMITMRAVILQVIVIDVVFSLDSAIMAVGIADNPTIIIVEILNMHVRQSKRPVKLHNQPALPEGGD